MKKHFMFMMAILMGLIISLGSCNNSSKKSSDDDEEDSEKTDKKKGKKSSKKDSKSKKSAKNSDTYEEEDWDYEDDDDYGSGYDDDDDDFEFDDIDDLKGTDLNSLNSEQANRLLKYVCDNSGLIFGRAGLDMDMRIQGNNLVMHTKMDFSSMGITASQFQDALQLPSVREEMISSMMSSAGNDGKQFLSLIAKAGKNLLVELEDTNTGEVATCSISRTELAALGQ